MLLEAALATSFPSYAILGRRFGGVAGITGTRRQRRSEGRAWAEGFAVGSCKLEGGGCSWSWIAGTVWVWTAGTSGEHGPGFKSGCWISGAGAGRWNPPIGIGVAV